jgi:hypothetical protein
MMKIQYEFRQKGCILSGILGFACLFRDRPSSFILQIEQEAEVY